MGKYGGGGGGYQNRQYRLRCNTTSLTISTMNEPEPVARGAIDILQQLAQALQRVAQPATVAP